MGAANQKLVVAVVLVLAALAAFFAFQYFSTQDELDETNEAISEAQEEITEQVADTNEAIVKRSRDTERRTDISSIATQLEIYYVDNGWYPDGVSEGFELNEENIPGTASEAFVDPDGERVQVSVDLDSADGYGYYYNPGGCDDTGHCMTFSFGTRLEESNDIYLKNNLN